MALPGYTYYIDSMTGHISSMVDGEESIVQSIYKALDTQKYNHLIYSWLYGLDMEPFIGQDVDFISTNIQPYLQECLLQDDRITSVQNIKVAQNEIDSCRITFTVITTEGTLEIEKDLEYGK